MLIWQLLSVRLFDIYSTSIESSRLDKSIVKIPISCAMPTRLEDPTGVTLAWEATRPSTRRTLTRPLTVRPTNRSDLFDGAGHFRPRCIYCHCIIVSRIF